MAWCRATGWKTAGANPACMTTTGARCTTFPDRTRNRLLQGAFRFTHRPAPGSELTASAYARNSRRDTVGGDVGDPYGDYVDDCADRFPDGSPANQDECSLTRADGEALHPASLNTTSTRQRGHGASINLAREAGGKLFNLGATWDRSRVHFSQFEQERQTAASRPTRIKKLNRCPRWSAWCAPTACMPRRRWRWRLPPT